ncbi:MAG: hypothetical protein AAGJ18_25745, partial [Bacteroidota bacterium]
MAKLIEAFGDYEDFDIDKFFVVHYDAYPSTVKLKINMMSETTKRFVDNVLGSMDLTQHNFELVYKSWKTENDYNADAE